MNSMFISEQATGDEAAADEFRAAAGEALSDFTAECWNPPLSGELSTEEVRDFICAWVAL